MVVATQALKAAWAGDCPKGRRAAIDNEIGELMQVAEQEKK